MLTSKTKSIEESVLEFQQKFGHFIQTTPSTDIPQSVKQLRRDLIVEEFKELIDGLMNDDLQEIADGGADLIYVVVGAMITYGIPIDRIFAEVHRSNMTKTAVKVIEGEKYGTKTPKGENYIAPDIMGILNGCDHTALEILEDAGALEYTSK